MKEEIIISARKNKTITLYKYISEVALHGLIEHGDFRVTYREYCNDPYEMLPAYTNPQKKHNRNDKQGFSSFSECPDNATLWGNYADKYAGARVEFEFGYFSENDINLDDTNLTDNALREHINLLKELGFNAYYISAFNDKGILKPSIFRHFLIKCKYVKERIKSECVISPGGITSEDEMILQSKKEHFLLTCTKGTDWKEEKECRLLIKPPHDSYKRLLEDEITMEFTKIPTPYIKSILLGPKSKYSKEEVKSWIEKQRNSIAPQKNYIPENVKIMKANYHDYLFSLDY